MEQTPEGIRFYRFTKDQLAIYPRRREALVLKSLATTGIKFCFETDSKSLYIKGNFELASSRSYFSVDVQVNDEIIGSMDNFSDVEIPPIYTDMQFPVGHYEKLFDLGEGIKKVTVYLPWNKIVTLQELSLDDGSFVKPIKFAKKLLAFGDSITQGFDAMRNYNRQIGRIARLLDAEEISKAVGAERYDPELAALRDDFDPDYVFVAYGTNDWSGLTHEEFYSNCQGFYANLQRNYPRAKMFVITPIWRRDLETPKAMGPFNVIARDVRQITANMENVTVIDGFTLVPHDAKYYADGRLHPNDAGFEHYFQNLWKAVQKAL